MWDGVLVLDVCFCGDRLHVGDPPARAPTGNEAGLASLWRVPRPGGESSVPPATGRAAVSLHLEAARAGAVSEGDIRVVWV